MLGLTLGHPPKVVLVRFGNCSVTDLIAGVAARRVAIESFAHDAALGLLALDRPA